MSARQDGNSATGNLSSLLTWLCTVSFQEAPDSPADSGSLSHFLEQQQQRRGSVATSESVQQQLSKLAVHPQRSWQRSLVSSSKDLSPVRFLTC